MFSNIGAKIKILAIAICVIGILGSIIYAILCFTKNQIETGIIYLIAGPILSWIGCFLLYGFGHLITNTDELVRQGNEKNNTRNDQMQ